MPVEGVMLRTQLLKWLALPLAVLFVADTTASYWMALRFAQQAYDRALVEMAREVSLHLRVTGGSLWLDLPAPAFEVLFNDPSDRIYHDVVTPDGKRVAGTPLPSPRGMHSTSRETLYDGRVEDADVRLVEIAVPPDGRTGRPAAIVRVAETTVRRGALAREMLMGMIVPQILVIGIAGIVVWSGVLRGLAPLEKLRASVIARRPHDVSRVPTEGVPGEVQPLLAAINELLGRLDGVVTLQRRFVADAAHQLKTPVAALVAQLELATRERDPARMQEQLLDVGSGLERLSRLVSQLLSLARNEPDAAGAVAIRPIDLGAVVLEAASAWVPEALKRHIDLGYEGPESPVPIDGDPLRLRELLDNLLDNAIRYTTEGGRVTVRLESGPPPAVRIADDGPAIAPADRSRIFERFHRLLGSPGDGSGLGLAIAQEIAHLHGAEINLDDDTDGVGNVFSVVFPGGRHTTG